MSYFREHIFYLWNRRWIALRPGLVHFYLVYKLL